MAHPLDAFKAKYPVHQETYDLITLLVTQGAQPFSTYSLEDARKTFLKICIIAGGEVNFDGQVKELTIPSPDSKNGIPISVYIPGKIGPKPPIMCYFHGGGLVLWERKCFETALKRVAMESGCIIVNVEYRRLPDEGTGFAPFDDAIVVAEWVKKNKEAVGGSPGSKVGVGGDSSGAQIAIGVYRKVEVDFQCLLYPHCDTSLTMSSIQEFRDFPVLPNVDLNWFTNQVIDHLNYKESDVRACPLARTDLKLAPATLIIHAQLDPLRDGGVAFAEKLKAAGVNVKNVMIEGVPHIFFGMCDVFKTKFAETLQHIVPFLRQFQ